MLSKMISLTLFNGVWSCEENLSQPYNPAPDILLKSSPTTMQDAAQSNVGAGNTDSRAKEPAVIANTVTVTVY